MLSFSNIGCLSKLFFVSNKSKMVLESDHRCVSDVSTLKWAIFGHLALLNPFAISKTWPILALLEMVLVLDCTGSRSPSLSCKTHQSIVDNDLSSNCTVKLNLNLIS